MKTLSFIMTIAILTIGIKTSAQNKEIISKVNITITDMQNNPSIGDKLFFVSEKTGKVYTCISGDAGKCEINLPNGQVYNIKIKTFDEAQNYTSVEIADTDYPMNLTLGIKYELPKTYTLKDVNFKTGSAELTPESNKSLNELAELLLLKKELKIELSGHTDDVGDDNTNLKLSDLRAISVKNYLIKKGINSQRLVAKGYGETMPVADNETIEGRAKNRRTEVHILE